MTRYVAFLRGINVGGNMPIRMVDLRAAFAAAGCANTRTYIQSGNVIFDLSGRSAPATFRKIDTAVAPLTGGKAPAILYRTAHDLGRMVKRRPFEAYEMEPDTKLYVAMLFGGAQSRLKPPNRFDKAGLEVIGTRGSDVYFVSRRLKNGMYGIPTALEKLLGLSMTTRNWNTIVKVAALSQGSIGA